MDLCSVLGRALGSSSCPRGVGVGRAGVCRSLQLPALCSLFVFISYTAPAWALSPSFSSPAGFLEVAREGVGGIQELNAAWSIKALRVFHKGELITEISVIKNKPPGDFFGV